MERLTYRDKDGFPMMKKRGGFKHGGVERLAAYEDTRLTPEEIDMDHEAAEQLRQLCQGCDLDRLEELAEADKNGRVVVIPRWKNEEERLERQRLMRIMADGAIDRLMKNPLKEENDPDIAELRVVNTEEAMKDD